ncbi:MAG: hypothetical protein ACTSYI_00865 [Promethearchaeota archaeon]
MAKLKKWNSIPVENEIISLLVKNRGEMLTSDLLRQLGNKYEDFSKKDLDGFLFKLEVRSYIFVIPIKKEVSKVEINPRGNYSHAIASEIKKFTH